MLPGWGRRVSCSIVRKAKEDEIENQVRIEIQALASSFLKISAIRKNWIECHSIGSKFDGRESTREYYFLSEYGRKGQADGSKNLEIKEVMKYDNRC